MSITLHINLTALRDNYRRLAALSAPAPAAAVVKANGYGAGAARCARALYREGCRFFYVYSCDEALALRRLLPAPAAVSFFAGPASGAKARAAYHAGVIPVINNRAQYCYWRDVCAAEGELRPFSLHVDTGMRRLGVPFAEAEATARLLREDGTDTKLRYLLSHLACADMPAHPLNAEQRAHMHMLGRLFPRARLSLANSSGVFLGAGYRFAQTRPGAALYGLHPRGEAGIPNPVTRAVTLRAKIRHIFTAEQRVSVGYKAAQTVPAGARLAVIDGGYADGIPFVAGEGRGFCVIGGAICRTAGRISMDVTTVDISAAPASVRPGDEAEWFGAAAPAEVLAAACGVADYTLLTGCGPRVIRTYYGG